MEPIIEARNYKLEQALNPAIEETLKDIMSCAPSTVSRLFTRDQIYSLSVYFNFPKNDKGEVRIDPSRKIVQRYLEKHPAFCSQNTDCVVYSLITYFQNHPNERPIQDKE